MSFKERDNALEGSDLLLERPNLLFVKMINNGSYEEALCHVQEAIKIDPQKGELYYWLGKIYDKKNLMKQAIENQKKAIEIDPDFAPAYYELLFLAFRNNEIEKYHKKINIPDAWNNYVQLRGQEEPAHFITSLLSLYENPEVLYFGDSVLSAISEYDVNKECLSSMLFNRLRKQMNIQFVRGGSYHTGLYYLYSKCIEYIGIKPRLIVIPVNMRVFSPQWSFNPINQCQMIATNLTQFLKKNKCDIKYDLTTILTQKEFFDTRVEYRGTRWNKIQEFEETLFNNLPKMSIDQRMERKRITFIYNYMYALYPNNYRLLLLKDTISLLNSLGIKCMIYVTPINYCAGLKYVGQEFLEVLNQNVKIMEQSLRQCCQENDMSELKIYDFSKLCVAEYFGNPNETTEHMGELGRTVIADLVSSLILNNK